MAKPLKQVVEFVNPEANSNAGTAVPKVNANDTAAYRAGAEMIPYHYDQPKEVVKFYDMEDVKKACQAWNNPYSGIAAPVGDSYVVMQASNTGWEPYQIGAPLRQLTPEQVGFIYLGGKYYCTREAFFVELEKQGLVPFTDFMMDVAYVTEHFTFDGDEQSRSFTVVVSDAIHSCFTVDIPADKWKNLLSMILAKDPVCTVYTDVVPRAEDYFRHVSTLLLQRRKLPLKLMVDRWGWGPVKQDGSREFYHGGRDDCLSDKSLMIDPTVSLKTGWSIVDVGDHQVTIPLLAYGAASYMDAIFTDAGYPMDFSIMLIGDSGFLKTAISKTLFNVFVREPQDRVHSVRGTEAAMHALTEELYEDVLVIDDFCLEGGTSEIRQKTKNIQGLMRSYSDKSPREKYSAKNRVKGYHVRGGLVVTGETGMLGQIKSAELRYLRVLLQRPIDGARLSVFQHNPAIMLTYWSRWIKYLESNYVDIQLRIKEAFPRYRNLAPVGEARLKDDFAHMLIVINELDKFMQQNCGCCVDTQEGIAIISELVRRQSENARQIEPYIRFLAEIFKLLGSGQLKMAPNVDEYAKTLLPFVGYEEVGGLYMMQPDLVYSAVIESARKSGNEIPIGLDDVKKKFKANGLLVCDKGGILKRASSKIKERPRMLCLNYQACVKKLEEYNL